MPTTEAARPSPIADLHCHYPMHILAEDEEVRDSLPRRVSEGATNLTREHMIRVRKQPGIWPKVRAFLLLIAAKLKSNESFESGWRVSMDKLAEGGIRLVCSVLYLPWTEIFGDADGDGDFKALEKHLKKVQAGVTADPRAQLVTTEAELDAVLDDGRIAILHCIEGGLHLGRDLSLIDDRVKALADRGVIYITLAHLIYRGVATNAPAIPPLSDRMYHTIFCQPRGDGVGLSAIGEEAVTAMHKHGVLVDVSHMRQDALDETFDLLKTLDGDSDPKDFPVIATHAGYRFEGGYEYMLSEETIGKIAARDGVVGLIMAQHQLSHKTGIKATSIRGTVATMKKHIDEIHDAAFKSHAHVGIGSDLDGFIKPTMAGISSIADLADLREGLTEAFPNDVDAILGGNAERVLRKALRARN